MLLTLVVYYLPLEPVLRLFMRIKLVYLMINAAYCSTRTQKHTLPRITYVYTTIIKQGSYKAVPGEDGGDQVAY